MNRDDMPPDLRAVSDTLDEYLMRMHGLVVSHTHAEDFIEWLAGNGYVVTRSPNAPV